MKNGMIVFFGFVLSTSLFATTSFAQSAQPAVVTLQCLGSDDTVEAMGVIYPSAEEAGAGWLQLTIVKNNKTYLDSELVHYGTDARGNLSVSSQSVDANSQPLLALASNSSYYTLANKTKISFSGCSQ